MRLAPIIESKKEEILALCHDHKVKRLFVFGSVTTSTFNHKLSDLDFVVEFEKMDPIQKGEKIIILWESLEDLFKRKVDLITEQPVRNPILQLSIEKSKQLIYDNKSEEIFN